MENVNSAKMDLIITETIDVIEKSKEEIFHINEEARKKCTNWINELKEVKEQIDLCIEHGIELENELKAARKYLSKISKNFNSYTEKDVITAYEHAMAIQTEQVKLQQEELRHRKRRDELKNRIRIVDRAIERGEGLVNKLAVILPYLTDDMKQMNHLIADAKEKYAFSLKVIQAQEEERRKIAREVHDGPAQMMANILLRLELVERVLRTKGKEEAIKELRTNREFVRQSLQDIRRLIYNLRPMALDDLGLVPTLKRYTESVSTYHDINITFRSRGKDMRLPTEHEISIFRLVQESIQNAIKHASASHIKVELTITDTNMYVSIADDGLGFDVKVKGDDSYGITGMKERVDMLSGELTIISTPGEGTRIDVNVPLN